jgi:hypothetical protein
MILSAASNFDLDAYSHTRQIDIREGRTTVTNPVECSGWLYCNATVVTLDLQ